MLGGSQFNRLSRSTDAGQTWAPIPDFPSSSQRSPFITKLANSKVDPDLVFAVSRDGIIRTDNFGVSWSVTPVQGNWLGWRPFDNVEVSNADPQIVWISGRLDVHPASGLRGGIHVSTDGGLSFTEISGNFPPDLAEAAGIATHPTDLNTAYMLFAGPGEPKVMRTTDLGQTWEELSGFGGAAKAAIGISSNGFPDVAVFSLLVMPFDTDILWAGTEIGLFESMDGGQTWTLANNGFPNVAIFEMSIVDDQVLVATQGRGVWSVTLPELEGYTPPVATLAPRLSRLALLPGGLAALDVNLRSIYDSTLVWLDGAVFARLAANDAPRDTLLHYPVVESKTITVSVASYRDGRAFRSAQRRLAVFPAAVVTTYTNDLDGPAAATDFSGAGFSVRQPAGFSDPAIHSQTSGDPSMYVSHEIDLLDTFQPGDVIFIRFRLHADPLAFAWGWAIDNIDIQPNAIVANEDAPGVPSAFHLGQNYPNPFNPTTRIPFALDAPGRVTLSVYDVAGRTVRTLLVDEAREVGTHAVGFDASGLASGTYLYRLAVHPTKGSGRVHVETKTLTVVK